MNESEHVRLEWGGFFGSKIKTKITHKCNLEYESELRRRSA